MKHGHYKKDVRHLSFIDPYRIAELYGISGPLEHAFKKVLCAGIRGAKNGEQDIQEAIDSLQRWQEMRAEDRGAYVSGNHNVWPESEERIDIIGANGPTGEHYEDGA